VVNTSRLVEQVEAILRAAREGQVRDTIDQLVCIVPTFVRPAFDVTNASNGSGTPAADVSKAPRPASGSAPMPVAS
jgi:hypothetical protein